jgi:hypothetical protein
MANDLGRKERRFRGLVNRYEQLATRQPRRFVCETTARTARPAVSVKLTCSAEPRIMQALRP